MDAEQFQQFLAAFTTSQKQMFQELATQLTTNLGGDPPRSASTNFVNMIPFENFDPKKERFSCYLQRFENYADMKNVCELDKKAQLLNASVGSRYYNELTALLGPDKPLKKLKYADLVEAYKKMLTPKKNVVVSQHFFFNTYQAENQTVSEFVATLQSNLAECEFHVKCECQKQVSIADVFLRAQFIRGLRDNYMREQILESDFTKFEDILNKAVSLEASRLQSKELSSKKSNLIELSGDPCINKVDRSHNKGPKQNKPDNYQKGRSRDRFPRHQGQNQSNTPQYRPRSSSRSTFRRNQSQSRDHRVAADYRALGIADLCFACGRNDHKSRDCRIDRHNLKCNACGKEGHVVKVCIKTLVSKKQSNNGATKQLNAEYATNFEPLYGIRQIEAKKIVDLFEIGPDADKYYTDVLINGKSQRFEVDSGARFTLLPEKEFHRLNLNLPLQSPNVAFRSYTGHIFKPLGIVEVTAAYKTRKIPATLYIVPDSYDAILGRQWIRPLEMDLKEIDSDMGSLAAHQSLTTHINSVVTKEDIVAEFPNQFQKKVGTSPGILLRHTLREGAKPCFTREREVPYALREAVDKQIDELEVAGIFTPIAICDWGSPLVVVRKPDGGVRLCIDYKCGVNARLVSAGTPIRRIDDVLHSLRNSKYFCKLDLYQAYFHFQVDEETSKIQAVTTHRGIYRVNRLAQGIKTAPSEFNRVLSQILKGLQKTEAYFDDIIIHGATMEECHSNLRACLIRLEEYDLHVNADKCLFFVTKIQYLGHVIEFNKIQKSPARIEAVQKIPRPSNVEEVQRFLGMVTYYSRFIPDFSTKSYYLRRLLQKNRQFFWSADCEAAFISLKSEICSDRVLMPFDPALPVVLTSDASPVGIAAILSHIVDGQERPIAFASRALTTSEQNYSQLDREALAILFGVTYFYNYLIGRHFILVTDNEPLTRIFHQNKALPRMTSARLLRYASFLSGFNYSVKFKRGCDNANVDCLSRAPITFSSRTIDMTFSEEVSQISAVTLFQITDDVINAKLIAAESQKDPVIAPLIQSLRHSRNESPYTIVDDILFRGDRVVIPQSLQQRILKQLHETHLGITKMKQLARRYVYWHGLDADIEKLVKSCEACALVKANPLKVSIHPWDTPVNNWDRIHIDYAGPYQDCHFLVVIDAKSKWCEVRVSPQAPTTQSTLRLLDDIFAVHGFPVSIVSDNATIFVSDAFKQYCVRSGIRQKLIAPGHPATNGLAERNVQTLKQRLRAMSNDVTSLREKVRQILFRYRATPLSCGKSPAELYLGRQFRTHLDVVFPLPPEPATTNPAPVRSFQLGERVQVQIFQGNKNIWVFGEITRILGTRHYIVLLDSGRSIKRHINQLRSTLVKKPDYSAEPPAYQSRSSYSVPLLPKDTSEPRQVPEVPPAPMEAPAPEAALIVPPRRSGRIRKPNVRFRDFVI